eukprot:413261_1
MSTQSVYLDCKGYRNCRCLVFGYVRDVCVKNNVYCPDYLKEICHTYFHQTEQWFAETKWVQNGSISIDADEQMCVHNSTRDWNSIFGSQVISVEDCVEMTWKLRVCGVDEGMCHIMIGIADNATNWRTTHWLGSCATQYAFYNENTNPILWNQTRHTLGQKKKMFHKLEQQLIMTLNLRNKTLDFTIDGQCCGGFTNIDNTKKYRMGISFYDGINKIQLI